MVKPALQPMPKNAEQIAVQHFFKAQQKMSEK
jgi:hypothetical protein